VAIEGREIIHPFRRDRDAPTAIVVKTWMSWIQATLFDIGPRLIFCGSRLALAVLPAAARKSIA
jgi:hypothetical protein